MAGTKRQGREKPAKIEQRKVKGRSEDLSEDLRESKRHSWLSLVCIGQAQGRKNIKGGAKALSLSLSPPLPQACALSLPPTLSPRPRLSLSLLHAGTLLHSLLCMSVGWHALTLRGWILLLSSK